MHTNSLYGMLCDEADAREAAQGELESERRRFEKQLQEATARAEEGVAARIEEAVATRVEEAVTARVEEVVATRVSDAVAAYQERLKYSDSVREAWQEKTERYQAFVADLVDNDILGPMADGPEKAAMKLKIKRKAMSARVKITNRRTDSSIK